MPRPRRILFVCEGNLHRSPTAEAVYCSTKGLHVRSAGTSPQARTEVTEELLEWADVVFVMESHIAKLLKRRFPEQTQAKPIHSLDIPDDFQRMQPELVALLTERLTPHLGPPAA
jgi:predicted protein tyrosine phosphatase